MIQNISISFFFVILQNKYQKNQFLNIFFKCLFHWSVSVYSEIFHSNHEEANVGFLGGMDFLISQYLNT